MAHAEDVHDKVGLAHNAEQLLPLRLHEWHAHELDDRRGRDDESLAVDAQRLAVSDEQAADLLAAQLASQRVDDRHDLNGRLALAQEPEALDLLLEESNADALDQLDWGLDALVNEDLLLDDRRGEASTSRDGAVERATIQEHGRELGVGLDAEWVEATLLDELAPLHLTHVLRVWESASGELEWHSTSERVQGDQLLQLVDLRQQVERFGVLVDEQETFKFIYQMLLVIAHDFGLFVQEYVLPYCLVQESVFLLGSVVLLI